MASDLRMSQEAEDAVDEGILGVVCVLRAAGVDTYSSCQGGGYWMGHGYMLPTVCFKGDNAGGRARRTHRNRGWLSGSASFADLVYTRR